MPLDIYQMYQGAIVLKGLPLMRMSEDEFLEFCTMNKEINLERTADGELLILPKCGGNAGLRHVEITYQLRSWQKRVGLGVAFGSNLGYELPNGAMRAPDASWITDEQWDTAKAYGGEYFCHFAPFFLIELVDDIERFETLQAKLREYMECGSQLGWLIDPYERKVEIYRPGTPPEELDEPATISGDPELPGFVLELEDVWNV